MLSIVRSFIVVFRSAKDRKNAAFAERKATLFSRTMLSRPKRHHTPSWRPPMNRDHTHRRDRRQFLRDTFRAGTALAGYLWHDRDELSAVPIDPVARRVPPVDALTATWFGTSTLLFSDGTTDWMVDGWFSRPGPLRLVAGTIEPDLAAIDVHSWRLALAHEAAAAAIVASSSRWSAIRSGWSTRPWSDASRASTTIRSTPDSIDQTGGS